MATTTIHSATSGTAVTLPGVRCKGTKRMWEADLGTTPGAFVVVPDGDYIRILTSDRSRALHCHPVGHGRSAGHTPTVRWTDIHPEGLHAVWRPEPAAGATALKWYPLGESHHHPTYRSWNLYLAVSDSGALTMSEKPYPWRFLETESVPTLLPTDADDPVAEPAPPAAPVSLHVFGF